MLLPVLSAFSGITLLLKDLDAMHGETVCGGVKIFALGLRWWRKAGGSGGVPPTPLVFDVCYGAHTHTHTHTNIHSVTIHTQNKTCNIHTSAHTHTHTHTYTHNNTRIHEHTPHTHTHTHTIRHTQ